jgi:DnaJ-domain-containing protein 1
MGIWDRLGDVINSYLHDEDTKIFKEYKRPPHSDPDLDAAFEELDDYLNRDRARVDPRSGQSSTDSRASASDQTQSGNKRGGAQPRAVPPELQACFAELGLPLGASQEECKEAYKKLLKIHHPDRHATHDGNFKKATEKTARLTVAYDRISQWRKG